MLWKIKKKFQGKCTYNNYHYKLAQFNLIHVGHKITHDIGKFRKNVTWLAVQITTKLSKKIIADRKRQSIYQICQMQKCREAE